MSLFKTAIDKGQPEELASPSRSCVINLTMKFYSSYESIACNLFV